MLVCSGDSGVYGMASLVYELAEESVQIQVISGVTAANSGAACLGAPLSHDFAVISLSDCWTPWELIGKAPSGGGRSRLGYLPVQSVSRRRAGYLKKACEIVEKAQSPDTVCGYVKNIGRDGQETGVLSLKELAEFEADMFTTVYIGNSRTKVIGGKMVTPRGYQVQ